MNERTGTMASRLDEHLVLVVEDSILVAMAIEDALADRGLKVCVAATLAAAEEIITEQVPDVALLDLRLPDGYSLDLACQLRDEGCAVAISSALDSGAVPDSHRFAVQFRKPTSPDLLADWVVTTLQTTHSGVIAPVQISSCSPPGTG